jgi:hypothetical protein
MLTHLNFCKPTAHVAVHGPKVHRHIKQARTIVIARATVMAGKPLVNDCMKCVAGGGGEEEGGEGRGGGRGRVTETIFPRIYGRMYYAHPRARVVSFSEGRGGEGGGAVQGGHWALKWNYRAKPAL